MKNISLLFITRNFPPTVGGLEKYSFDLYTNLKEIIPEVSLIANRRHLKSLPWFFVRTFFYTLLIARNFSNIHLADGTLAILIPYLRIVAPKAKITISIHGLDIVFSKYFYQHIIPKLVAKADAIICVSTNTKQECLNRGIPETKCRVIPNGIDFGQEGPDKVNPAQFEESFNLKLSGRRILFSIGRLVKRKGIVWFIENVMTETDDSTLYLIAGYGSEEQSVINAITRLNLKEKVFFLGKVTETQKTRLFRMADYFIMPNIKMKNDIEGFGLTVLEAGKYGVTVLAAAVDGLRDSVIDGKTGYLIREKEAAAFLQHLRMEPLPRDSVRIAAKAHFSWHEIVRRYHQILSS